jgi:hypothetical protein
MRRWHKVVIVLLIAILLISILISAVFNYFGFNALFLNYSELWIFISTIILGMVAIIQNNSLMTLERERDIFGTCVIIHIENVTDSKVGPLLFDGRNSNEDEEETRFSLTNYGRAPLKKCIIYYKKDSSCEKNITLKPDGEENKVFFCKHPFLSSNGLEYHLDFISVFDTVTKTTMKIYKDNGVSIVDYIVDEISDKGKNKLIR